MKFTTIRYLLLLMLLSIGYQSISQNFGDKEFYLIDSLDLDNLSENDKTLIDTSLVAYHNTLEDTIELEMLENIVDNCWNEKVWPRYNLFLISEVKKSLTFTNNQTTEKKLIYFLAGGISNLGFYYDQDGNLIRATEYYHESLILYERIDNKEGCSTIHNNLGVIYNLLGDSTKALEYHRKALKLKKELNDRTGIALSYNNIGTIYKLSGKPFIALNYYESSLKLYKEINNKRGIAISNNNLGDIYLSEQINGKALNYYREGLAIWTALDDQTGICSSKNNIALTLLAMGHIKRAKNMALESYELALELGHPEYIENSARTLVIVYRNENNFELALHYSDIQQKIDEDTRNSKNSNLAYKKSMQYEYQKQTIKDSLGFAKELEFQDIKLAQQKTQSYALYGGLILMLGFILFGLKSFQQKKKDNKKINEQKAEVEIQKQEIEKQHKKLIYTHQEISDSIAYAKRIQSAILPDYAVLDNYFDSSFVHYRPKDVVSGDFYWISEQKGSILIAVADCTGHGVPGAMVSVVCHNALSRVVNELKVYKPSEILNKTREYVIEALHSQDEHIMDGMDISLCAWNKSTKELEWAGAYNPLYIVRANSKVELEIAAGDRQPVGSFALASPFTNHIFNLEKGDVFYLLTDGFQDQFGGINGKKYKIMPFRKLMIKISQLPLNEQSDVLDSTFHNWKGNLEQVDDICLIGIKV